MAARTPKPRFTPAELATLYRAQERARESLAQLAGMAETLDRAVRDIKWFVRIIDDTIGQQGDGILDRAARELGYGSSRGTDTKGGSE